MSSITPRGVGESTRFGMLVRFLLETCLTDDASLDRFPLRQALSTALKGHHARPCSAPAILEPSGDANPRTVKTAWKRQALLLQWARLREKVTEGVSARRLQPRDRRQLLW